MRNKLWGVGQALALAITLVACQPQAPTKSEPTEQPRLTLNVTGINWDAANNTPSQTYFSVDVRVSTSPPLRDGHALQPKRFTYELPSGATASSGSPYLVGESSCAPSVLFTSSRCRVHFVFREGLTRAELVPSTLRYNAGLTGSVRVLEVP